MQVNDTVQVFDAQAWFRAGGDIGDNSQFYRTGTIISLYSKGGQSLADVSVGSSVFRGCFVWALKK